MSNITDDNIVDNFDNPNQFMQQLNTLSEKLPSILEDFKKYYVFYNKNPEYYEYKSHFDMIKNSLNSINSDMHSLSSNIQKDIDDMNDILISLNSSINQLKTENSDINNKLKGVEVKYNAANEMILNYKTIYDYNYLRNWGLLLSIIIAAYSVSYIYKNKINA